MLLFLLFLACGAPESTPSEPATTPPSDSATTPPTAPATTESQTMTVTLHGGSADDLALACDNGYTRNVLVKDNVATIPDVPQTSCTLKFRQRGAPTREAQITGAETLACELSEQTAHCQ